MMGALDSQQQMPVQRNGKDTSPELMVCKGYGTPSFEMVPCIIRCRWT